MTNAQLWLEHQVAAHPEHDSACPYCGEATALTVSWKRSRFERPTPEIDGLPEDEYGTRDVARQIDHIGYLHRSVGGINPADRANLVANLRAVRDLAAVLVAQVEARIEDGDDFPYEH